MMEWCTGLTLAAALMQKFKLLLNENKNEK